MAQSIEDRSKILYKRKLCYKCLSEISKEHNAKSCSKGRSCKVCNGSHPTVLHGVKLKKKGNHGNNDSKERGVEIAYPSINTGSDIISMWIVLVQIRQRESGKVLQTYALLDNCSQGKFILDQLTKDLYIPEKKHPLPSKKKRKKKMKNIQAVPWQQKKICKLQTLAVTQVNDYLFQKHLPGTNVQWARVIISSQLNLSNGNIWNM